MLWEKIWEAISVRTPPGGGDTNEVAVMWNYGPETPWKNNVTMKPAPMYGDKMWSGKHPQDQRTIYAISEDGGNTFITWTYDTPMPIHTAEPRTLFGAPDVI